ncbi:MAG: FAD-dependent oxidoreductase [Verrucomicrobiaceae bacterium]|nr:FAD-dependent oxidoreductase [Verrucomicrobiaceae bacterium]
MVPHSILILGGGCFGLTAALELRSRGWSVTLMDQGRLPQPDAASTDISKVVRMDYGVDAQHTAMGLASIEGWRRWNRAWGMDLYHEDGFLVMSREEMRPGSFEHDSFHYLMAQGHALRRMNASGLRQQHPAWNAEAYVDGYFNAVGGWVESGRAIAQLARDARSAGVVIHEEVKGARPIFQAGRCIGIESASGEVWSADLVLVATGAWTPEVLPHLQKVIRATAQTVFHFQPAQPEKWCAPHFPVWGADIAKTGWYGFPANADGIVKVANHGPGRPVLASEPRTLPDGEEERYRAFLRDTFPALAEAPVHSHRVCLYCDTFDGAFWIDHDREHAGLVVAAGDSGHAFKFTPVLGGIIADVVEGKANDWSARYRWREPTVSTGDGARASHS